MRYKKFKLKFAAVFIAALSFCIGMNAYALQKIEIIPAAYDTGAPAKTLANNIAVSMTSNKQVGYKVNFSDTPASLKINLGCYKPSQATIEVWLDDASKGTLLGSIITEPTASWEKREYMLSIQVPMKGEHTIYVKSKGGTCDFNAMSFLINEPEDVYPSFSENGVFGKVGDVTKQNKLNTLYELGILSNEKEYNGEELITRREYIRIIDKLYDEGVVSDVQIFEDITPDDKDFNAISNLYSRKIIKGATSGKLVPDKFITIEEMLKMSLRAMGYSYAEEMGESTFVTASNAGILSGINVSEQAVRRDEMVNLLYNMLTGNVVKTSPAGHNTQEYKTVKEGVLSVTKNIKFGVDILSDNGFTNIYDVESNVKKGEVQIGDNVFSTNGTNAANYLGMKCLFFYKDDNAGDCELVAVSPYNKMDYVVLSTKDTEFKDIRERYISYFDERYKEKELELSPSTSFTFNGKAIDKELRELIPDISKFLGTIIAIDNDKDGVYDVVLIESYVSAVFGGSSDDKIYDKLTNAPLQIFNKDEALIYVDGGRIDWDVIPQNSVIDIYQSKNSTGEKIERIIVNTNTIEGAVSGINDDKLIVAGEEYGVYYDVTDIPVMGQNYILYLNTDNQIVNSAKTTDSIKLGYIFSIRPVTNADYENTYVVKLFSEENKVEKLYFAENVTIDGVRVKGLDELTNGKAPFEGAGTLPVEKPVLYKTNSEGLITYFDTTETSADNDQDVLEEILAEGYYNPKSVGLTVHGTKNPVICAFAANKKIITLWHSGEEELATISTSLNAGTTTRMNASAYTTLKDSMLSDIIVWKRTGVGDHKTDFVFKSLATKVDENGEVVTILQGVEGSAEIEYPINNFKMDVAYEDGSSITNKELVASLKPGDLLSVGINARGEAEVINPVLFVDGEATNNIGVTATLSKGVTDDSAVYERGITSHGKVVDVEEGIIKLEMGSGADVSYDYVQCAGSPVVMIEENNGKVTITNNLNINHIMVNEHVVVAKNPEAYSAATIFLYETIDW